jgi:hypothetical protein
MFPESLNAVMTRRPQADVVISGYEIATVAARLRNDVMRCRRLIPVTEQMDSGPPPRFPRNDMFPESLNAVITRRPQADVVISGYEIATVAALLRNDVMRCRRLIPVTEQMDSGPPLRFARMTCFPNLLTLSSRGGRRPTW